MNKQSIIGLVLIFGIFVGYMWWVAPSEEEMRQRYVQDSIARAELAAEQHLSDSIANAERLAAEERASLMAALTDSNALGDEAIMASLKDKYKQFAPSAMGDTATIVMQNEKMTLEVNTLGGQLNRAVMAEYTTYDQKDLELITPSGENLDLTFTIEGRDIHTKDLVFAPYLNGKPLEGHDTIKVAEGEAQTLGMRAYIDDQKGYLEFEYTMHDNYIVDYNLNFHGLSNVIKDNGDMYLFWKNSMNRQEQVDQSSKGSRNPNKDPERNYTSIYYKPSTDDVDYLKEGADGEENLSTSLTWIAYKQQFFSAILINDSNFLSAEMEVKTDKEDTSYNYLCDMSSALRLDYDNEKDCSCNMHFYLGPNKYSELSEMDQDFERMLPLGWGFFLIQWVSRFAVIPVFNFLEQFNWNYGIIIIVLTVLLKIVLFPLTYKSYKSSAVMRILKPEMDALNKKYPNQDQMMQKSQEQQRLYKRAGISPMAGCLPMLLQMPILYAMFRFFPSSIELRQQSFLWADDLSTYDSVLDFGFNIPLYGDHISLFCLLMFGMQFFYTWYTMKSQAGQASMPGMKFMMYFMPFMMLFLFNNMSAALNLYYLLSLTITMIQMVLIRKFTSEKKVRARMAAFDLKMSKAGKNGKVKKSKFQQRLEALQKQAEEMQKQQQQQQRRR